MEVDERWKQDIHDDTIHITNFVSEQLSFEISGSSVALLPLKFDPACSLHSE